MKEQTNHLIHVEKLHDDLLWVINISTYSRAAVDAWEATIRDYSQIQRDSGYRFFVMDLGRVNNLGFTAYLRSRLDALAKENRSSIGRMSAVLSVPTPVYSVFDRFGALTSARWHPQVKVKFFREREPAITWVAAGLQAVLEKKQANT